MDRDGVIYQASNDYFLDHYPLDPDVVPDPKAYKCCTLSRHEYSQLKPILPQIVRKGRVSSISTSEIQLKDGTIPANKDTVIIDCSSNGLTSKKTVPQF